MKITNRQLAEEAVHRLYSKVHIITQECAKAALPSCSVGKFIDDWVKAVADIIEDVYKGNVHE